MAEGRGPSWFYKTIAGNVLVGALRNSHATGGRVWSWGNVAGLALDDSAIADYTSATGVAGKDMFLRLQSALDSDLNGGSYRLTTGAKHGTGADGTITWDAGAHYFYAQGHTADEYLAIDIEETTANVVTLATGTQCTAGIEIATGAGDIILDPAGNNVNPGAAQEDYLGATDAEWCGGYFGEDTTTGSVSTSGLYLGLGQEARIRYNKDATGFPGGTMILGVSASGVAAADRLCIAPSKITATDFVHPTADTSGNDIYIHGMSGSTHAAANPDGGDIVVVPGELGAGGSGTAGVFSIADPSSTDVISLYHDGAKGSLSCTHRLHFASPTRHEDGVILGFGTDNDWQFIHQTTNPTDHLELREGAVGALAFFGSTLQGQGFDAAADTDGNDIWIGTQTGGTHSSNNPSGGTLTFEMGDSGGGDGSGGDFVVIPGAETGAGTIGKFKIQDADSADTIDFWHTGTQGRLACTGTLDVTTAVEMQNNNYLQFGNDNDWSMANVTTNPANHLALLESSTPALCFFGSTIIGQGFNAATNVDGNDIYIATQSALDNNKRGGDIYFELGAEHGTGRRGQMNILSQTGIGQTAAAGAALTAGWNADTMEGGTTYARHLYTQGNITELADAAITDICGWYINSFTITDGGGTETVGFVATCYIEGAPTTGTAPTGGTYALYVDADTSRFDGPILCDGGLDSTGGTIDSNATTLSFDAGATIDTSGNNLLTLTGGTAGVRIDDYLAIDSAPDADRDVYTGRTFTGSGSANIGGFHAEHTVTMGVADSYMSVFASPGVTEAASGTHPTISGVYINNFTVTDGGGTEAVTNLAGLYIAGAPVQGSAPTNGPYSIFVDAGTSRFDGAVIWENAAGPTIVNEAATIANPTLIPNRAEEDTGFGWAAADTLTSITGGVDAWNVTSAELNHSNAAATKVHGITLITDTIYLVRAHVVGRLRDGPPSTEYRAKSIEATCHHLNGAAAVVEGAQTILHEVGNAASAAWTIDFVANGDDIEVRCTTTVAESCDWHVTIEYCSIASLA